MAALDSGYGSLRHRAELLAAEADLLGSEELQYFGTQLDDAVACLADEHAGTRSLDDDATIFWLRSISMPPRKNGRELLGQEFAHSEIQL